jgi:hypothetical protein
VKDDFFLAEGLLNWGMEKTFGFGKMFGSVVQH